MSVAADGLADNNGLVMPVNKIHRNERFILMGSGDHSKCIAHWRRIKDLDMASAIDLGWPDKDDEQIPGMIIVNSPNPHIAWWLVGTEWSRLNRRFHAIGSGRDFAIAAMALGSTAKAAVQLACMLDVYSGGEVESISLAG